MKTVFSFFRATLTGGIFFLLPVFLLVSLFLKAQGMVEKIITPLEPFLPDRLIGMPAGKLVAAILLVLICFLCGMLFRIPVIRKAIGALEEGVLSHIPGYDLLKSKASDTLGEKIDHYLATVVVRDGETWHIGLLIEEVEDRCTVFFPEAPGGDSGEVVIVPSAHVKKVDISAREMLLKLKGFGKETAAWV